MSTSNDNPYREPEEPDWEDYNDEEEFIPCSGCDGHPACEDFGCAIEAGLGRMVQQNLQNPWDW